MSYTDMVASKLATDTQVIYPIALYDSFAYSMPIKLEDSYYSIRLYFLKETSDWWISMFDDDDSPIFLNRRLTPSYPIIPPRSTGLTGYFYLLPVSDNTLDKWDDLKYDLSKNYTFFYIY